VDHSRSQGLCGSFAKGLEPPIGPTASHLAMTVESDLAPRNVGLATACHCSIVKPGERSHERQRPALDKPHDDDDYDEYEITNCTSISCLSRILLLYI